MIFSERWLRQWVDPQMDTAQLVEELTMAGLEVDAVKPAAAEFSGIIVAEITAVDKHPDADKLSVCQVNNGSEILQVVCGAANVRPGLKVPFATVGASIQGDDNKPFTIKKARLRGVESNGMLCSAEELGMAESSEGLMELAADAPIGKDIRDYLQLNDNCIELDLTPNRGDCLGMTGLAREVGVLSRTRVNYSDIPRAKTASSDVFPVIITAKKACPRYLGRVIRSIKPNVKSPFWLREKLRRSGLRSIDPVVDVTNYVLLELGQPMHAFDLAELEGHIEVRLAKDREKLTLLDGKVVELSKDTLVIADRDKALAIAGIMGGRDTAVTQKTHDVFLECAFFSPLALAGKARSYGLHTDASHRYERGVDYEIQHDAMERATQLLLDIVGGEAGPIIEAIGQLPKTRRIELKTGSIKRLLGVDMEKGEVRDILTRLGFTIDNESQESLLVVVPSFRFDVSIEADLIEELARIYGYNKLPQTGGLFGQTLKSRPEAQIDLSRLRHQLVALGYQEVITYSFIDEALARRVCPHDEPIKLQNPISADMSVMRSSLLPGLLSTLKYNENRQQQRIRLFESGLVFKGRAANADQPRYLSGLISGSRSPENWTDKKELTGFYDVKGDVESLLTLCGQSAEFEFAAANLGCFHSGQCASISRSGELLGHVGALHPSIQRELGLNDKVYLFELALAPLQKGSLASASELSRFPEVHRDLAVLIKVDVPAAQILSNVRANAGAYLSDVRIFDVYQGDAIDKNEKSIALGLTWQHPSRTLGDDEINTIISSCVNALEDGFNARLRT